jgi:peptidoglycan/xylan/chitin deacetylase (PgdA/CDA1 family)
MSPSTKQLLLHTARIAGLGAIMRRWNRRKFTILMLHGFTPVELPGLVNCEHKHLTVGRFETFLKFLKRHYHVISMADAVASLSRGESLPQGAVSLTFDDGFLSNHADAFPLLLKYQLPATIYVATEFVDEHKPVWVDRVVYAHHMAGRGKAEMTAVKNRLKKIPQEDLEPEIRALEERLGHALENSNGAGVPMVYHALEWEDVREMQASGLVTFGAHTHTHKILGRCRSSNTIRDEIIRSKRIIERETGRECLHFCYPNGGHGDFSEETERIAKEAGFLSTLTGVGGSQSNFGSPYLLKRFGVTNDLDETKFNLTMCGLLPWFYNRTRHRP